MWAGWEDFWAMGGYAFYVWGAYAVTTLVMLAEIVLLGARHRRALAHLRDTLRSAQPANGAGR